MEKQCQNREQQAQAKLDREQIASLENDLRSSQRAGKELQAASTQLSSQLEAERAQNEEQIRNIEQQKNIAESELEETRCALLKSRDETARFSSQLETERGRMKNKSATLTNKRTSRRASLKKRGALCSKAAMKPRESRAFWKFGIRTALVSHFTPGFNAASRFRADCASLVRS